MSVIVSLFMLPAPLLSAQTLSANKTTACDALKEIGSSCSEGESDISKILKTVNNLLSFIIGVISVIMIIVAGLRYITSGGDAKSTGAAKNTIIYAVLGLVVVVFAQTIVKYILKKFA